MIRCYKRKVSWKSIEYPREEIDGKPTYTLHEFVAACGSGADKVFIFKGAKETAKSDFNLFTGSFSFEFYSCGGRIAQFVNTKPWENNQTKS